MNCRIYDCFCLSLELLFQNRYIFFDLVGEQHGRIFLFVRLLILRHVDGGAIVIVVSHIIIELLALDALSILLQVNELHKIDGILGVLEHGYAVMMRIVHHEEHLLSAITRQQRRFAYDRSLSLEQLQCLLAAAELRASLL